MNGMHDLGGKDGFGPVRIEPDEPVFHARWEARVFGIRALVNARLGRNIDAGRHRIERLAPIAYLSLSYYGRWLASLEQALWERGILAAGELEARIEGRSAAARPIPLPPTAPPPPHPFLRSVDRPPAFRVGDAVLTRNHQPAGHTRLPAYARCRRGVIARVYPACVFPDTHAHDLGEQPQHVYCVRFDGGELWGDAAEAGTCVYVDLFESYLEPEPAA